MSFNHSNLAEGIPAGGTLAGGIFNTSDIILLCETMNLIRHQFENVSFNINLTEGILADGIIAGGTFNTPDIIPLC